MSRLIELVEALNDLDEGAVKHVSIAELNDLIVQAKQVGDSADNVVSMSKLLGNMSRRGGPSVDIALIRKATAKAGSALSEISTAVKAVNAAVAAARKSKGAR